jgi:hypothetical protein
MRHTAGARRVNERSLKYDAEIVYKQFAMQNGPARRNVAVVSRCCESAVPLDKLEKKTTIIGVVAARPSHLLLQRRLTSRKRSAQSSRMLPVAPLLHLQSTEQYAHCAENQFARACCGHAGESFITEYPQCNRHMSESCRRNLPLTGPA